ncbi:MAG TPA: hypothetical protein VF635_03845 [Propionibacteriaceae bacterium]
MSAPEVSDRPAPRGLANRRRRRPRLTAPLAFLLIVLGGCTYAREEPGLFSQRQSESNPRPAQETLSPPEPANPKLPVAGEVLWTTAEGLGVQTRMAVHAIRRIGGATVLDWSVTPLRAPGLSLGDRIPSSVEFGLTRESYGDVNITLVDPSRGKIYRPLSHKSRQELHHCLCTPLWVTQLSLRIGETRLLQVAYPELPATVTALDVDLATLPPFVQVPVTGIGLVPTARRSVDLTRPERRPSSTSTAVRFFSPQGQSSRVQSVSIDRVLASPGQTSVAWTLTSVTDQPAFGRLPPDPPVSRRVPTGVVITSQKWASGPVLIPAGGTRPALGPQWMTSKLEGRDYIECRCTRLDLWAASVRERGGRVTVTTNYPPLAAGTTAVDVLLPGAGRVRGVVVETAVAAARNGRARPADPREPWVYVPANPPRGWQPSEWPTPLPAVDELRDYLQLVDDIVSLPR